MWLASLLLCEELETMKGLCVRLREASRRMAAAEVCSDTGSRNISRDHGLVVFHEMNGDGGVERLFFVHILKMATCLYKTYFDTVRSTLAFCDCVEIFDIYLSQLPA